MALSSAIGIGVGSSSYLVRPYLPITTTTTFTRPFSGNSFGSSQEYNFRMIPHDFVKSEPPMIQRTYLTEGSGGGRP